MKIDTIVVGPIQVNCYIVSCLDTSKAAVIDPGDDESVILKFIKNNNLQLSDILLTHGHVDHIAAVSEIKETTGAKIRVHRADEYLIDNAVLQAEMFGLRVPALFKVDEFIKDADIIKVGNIGLKVLETPGHSPGSVCFLTGEHLFAGDTLFMNSIGRTDLPGGSQTDLVRSIRKRLFNLDKNVQVYPGHGDVTSIGYEIRNNPYVAME